MFIQAYIDPGLGALVWQSLVAAFVGLLFYIRKIRNGIIGAIAFFVNVFRRTPRKQESAARMTSEKIGANTEPR